METTLTHAGHPTIRVLCTDPWRVVRFLSPRRFTTNHAAAEVKPGARHFRPRICHSLERASRRSYRSAENCLPRATAVGAYVQTGYPYLVSQSHGCTSTLGKAGSRAYKPKQITGPRSRIPQSALEPVVGTDPVCSCTRATGSSGEVAPNASNTSSAFPLSRCLLRLGRARMSSSEISSCISA